MKSIKSLLLIAVAALMLASCGTTSTVPITGRKHTLLVDDAQVLSLSKQQYNDVLKQSTLSKDAANTAMVKRVGQRLANAVEAYLKANGAESERTAILRVGVQPREKHTSQCLLYAGR